MFFHEAAKRKRPSCWEAWTLKARLKELQDSPRQGKLLGSHVTAAVVCFYRRDVICATLDRHFMAWAGPNSQSTRSRDTYSGSL